MVMLTGRLCNVWTIVVRHFSEKHALSKLLTAMPKITQTSRVKLRHVRNREKLEASGRVKVSANVQLQVVGAGGRGTPRAVMIVTDSSKYLFNCGEGTQRITSENKMRIAKLENIFITHRSWENIGGLLGMALTLEGINVPALNIHGPPGVESITKMVRAFADTTTVNIEKKKLTAGCFEDKTLNIEYVSLQRTSVLTETADVNMSNEPVAKKAKPTEVESNIVVAYICRMAALPQKVNLEKCVDLGIKPGPVIGQLVQGNTVTLDDGTVINPEQILDPKEEPHPILILECPKMDWVDLLFTSPQLKLLQETRVKLVVHMSQPNIMASEKYKQWMDGFGPDTRHLVVNSDCSQVSLEGTYHLQTQLHLLHDKIFPMLPHLVQPSTSPTETEDGQIVNAMTGMSFNLRETNIVVNREHCITLNKEEYEKEVTDLPEVPQLLHDLKVKLKGKATGDKTFPQVVFLGTGSSIPSKRRNCSGILLHLSEDSSMVLDCGEDTAGQLYRHYGDSADDVLCKIKAVYISHMHADHHLGLFTLLKARIVAHEKKGLPCKSVLLLAPIQIRRWLEFYDYEVEAICEQYKLVAHSWMLQHLQDHMAALHHEIKTTLDLDDYLPVEVDHCPNSFGVCINHKDGWKVVYSGDTMPCERLVQAGRDCDLLIHEATMEDDLELEAKFKKHSTTSQAIDIGERMKARFILLTHFSQRYTKIPVFNDKFTNNVGIAFDNLCVGLSDLPLLPLFVPALKTMFAEECSQQEDRSIKRKFKKDRLEKESVEKDSSQQILVDHVSDVTA